MFEDVLAKAKGGEQDLGRVIVRHTDLNHPIVVPLDKWSNINANTVMTAVENVLNSDETLKLSDQTEILVGNISIPKGSGRVHVTQLQGPQSSIALKRSMLRVANSDHMCLATAVGRCFVKLCKIVTLEEFKRITENDRPNMSATMKMNEIMNCKDGYRPGEPCAEKCTIEARCSKCRKCVHCEESWCGLEEHKVNFAVLQTACENAWTRI
ncbi:unnamed protein product [Mytilus edulis]|uniref:Uncharacterized protein n=1 Tax=Mytilus edulis TaxID=6550 RepID=A0A8S3U8K7_MYTED|nr:unnamed protein product [Mytilus edulis]